MYLARPAPHPFRSRHCCAPLDPTRSARSAGKRCWRTSECNGRNGPFICDPLDIDPDAVRNIVRNWDISAIAAPGVVEAIAAQTAGESLATWGVMDPTPSPPTPAERLDTLSVPTLVLWGSEDAGLDRASQERLIDVLKQASRTNKQMYFYWKQYGVRPPPRSGNKHDADDIGHNLSWEAPLQLAADIDSFVRTGAPTRDLYRTDAPANIHRILVEPGKASIVTSRP